jgi:hypothetical protein
MIDFSIGTFRDRFPEFRPVGMGVINSAVDAGRLEMDEDRFADLGPEALMLLVAHKLATSPFGMNARLVDSENKTSYEREFRRLQRLASVPSVLVS